jgi:hypothetical protein
MNDGGPAFPFREEDGGGGYFMHQGMALRDWFAGEVHVTQKEILDYLGVNDTGTMMGSLMARIPAEAAIRFMKADAMLAAREQKAPAP